MAYGNKYILSFSNELNEFYEIFFDYLDYVGVSNPIIAEEAAFTIKSNSDEEDRFVPIIGLQCDISIFVGKANTIQGVVDDSTLTIYDLIASQDNQIRITIYKDNDYTKTFFQGFVVVQDNNQDFQDPPFTLSITALDGLGLLKGIDFLDTTGAAYAGSMSPVKWLGQMLYKTGQKLRLRVYFNIINTTYPLIPCIESFKIGVVTFQTGQPQTTTDPTIDLAASAADDCYTVMEKICRNLRCRLFQQEGVWNMVNIWEHQNPAGMSYVEYVISEPTAGIVSVTPMVSVHDINYDVPVGSDQIIHPVKDDAKIWLKLATKSEKLTYTYDQSLNVICNQSLVYGNADPAHDGTISSTFQNPPLLPVVTFSYTAFDAFCFTHLDGPGAFHPYPGIAPTAPAYIREVDDVNGYTVDRYLVLSKPTSILTYLRSSKFMIDQGDILDFTFDWRTKENENVPSGTGTAPIAYILLYGIDGTFWAFGYAPQGTNKPSWTQMPDANFVIAGNTPALNSPQFTDSGLNGYMNNNTVLQAPSGLYYAPAPVSGDIEILFLYLRDQLPAVSEYWFKNISISIIPFMNGSFKPLKGDFNFASSNQVIKQTDSQDVEISDSPKRYFKGALLQTDGKSLMPPTWIRNGISGTPKRFTQLMEEFIYNGVYRQFQKIEGTMRGLTWVDSALNVREAGLINSYYFPNHPIPTKKFMLTSFENDYGTGYGRRVFIEILNDQNDTGQVVPDNYIFQYLFE